MHHSRLCALLIDCNTSDLDGAAGFWAQALGRPLDPESRVHLDIETDDISAEVAHLEKAGAGVEMELRFPWRT